MGQDGTLSPIRRFCASSSSPRHREWTEPRWKVAGVVHQCKLTATIAFSPSFFRIQFDHVPIEILIEQEAAVGGGHT